MEFRVVLTRRLAIGMRGPITSVFQNVFLMIFIIDLAIGVGIWMPFTMGKTTALLFVSGFGCLGPC